MNRVMLQTYIRGAACPPYRASGAGSCQHHLHKRVDFRQAFAGLDHQGNLRGCARRYDAWIDCRFIACQGEYSVYGRCPYRALEEYASGHLRGCVEAGEGWDDRGRGGQTGVGG